MSSFNVFGFLALTAGNRVATQPAGAKFPVHHCYYTTSLRSSNDVYVAATLRVYSGAGDAPLPDNTVAFVVAKAFAPTGKPMELDAFYVFPVPGDVNSDTYDVSRSSLLICAGLFTAYFQDNIPEIPVFIYGVGHIPADQTTETLPDGSKTFTISLSEYVSGGPKSSTIQCAFFFNY